MKKYKQGNIINTIYGLLTVHKVHSNHLITIELPNTKIYYNDIILSEKETQEEILSAFNAPVGSVSDYIYSLSAKVAVIPSGFLIINQNNVHTFIPKNEKERILQL